MENKFQIKWETIEDPETQPRSLRKIKTLDFAEFKNNVLSQEQAFVDDLVDSLYAGDAYILKNAFSTEYLTELISKAHKYGKESESTFHPMVENCPDFNRIVDEDITKKYSIETVRKSHYFFPWNEDPLNLFGPVNERWRIFKFLGGFQIDEYEKNTPIDGVVDRIQICNYPAGGGKLNFHYDPYANQRVIIGAMMSKRGKDYSSGGFYCVNAKREKVDFEERFDVGDMVCSYPTVVHGVEPVDSDKPREWSSIEGRWFLGLYSNDSNHIQKRQTTVPLTSLEEYIL